MIQKLLFAFVTLIVGLVLIGSVATSTAGVTSLIGVSNEVHNVASPYAAGHNDTAINPAIVYTVTNAPTGWKSTDCPLTNFVLTNSSGFVFPEGATQAYILNAAAGTWTLRDTAGTLAAIQGANNTYASYAYCPDNYVSSWGGTVLALVPGFFALAILLTSVALFYSVGRDAGII